MEPNVRAVVEGIRDSEMGNWRDATAWFSGGRLSAQPEVDPASRVCATCCCFTPPAEPALCSEGGLGTCDIHSAMLGLFAPTATCDEWTPRD